MVMHYPKRFNDQSRSIIEVIIAPFHQSHQDRDSFASQVRDVAAPDVAKMGMEILSFTIKDVNDNVDYLNSLGRTQTAIVKRDADIGVAEAERDAAIKVCAVALLHFFLYFALFLLQKHEWFASIILSLNVVARSSLSITCSWMGG